MPNPRPPDPGPGGRGDPPCPADCPPCKKVTRLACYNACRATGKTCCQCREVCKCGTGGNEVPPGPNPNPHPGSGGGGVGAGDLFYRFIGFLAAALIVGLVVRGVQEQNRNLAYMAVGVILLGVLVVDKDALSGLERGLNRLMGIDKTIKER